MLSEEGKQKRLLRFLVKGMIKRGGIQALEFGGFAV